MDWDLGSSGLLYLARCRSASDCSLNCCQGGPPRNGCGHCCRASTSELAFSSASSGSDGRLRRTCNPTSTACRGTSATDRPGSCRDSGRGDALDGEATRSSGCRRARGIIDEQSRATNAAPIVTDTHDPSDIAGSPRQICLSSVLDRRKRERAIGARCEPGRTFASGPACAAGPTIRLVDRNARLSKGDARCL